MGITFRTAVLHGITFDGYLVSSEGIVYSKRNGMPLSWCVGGGNLYPRITLTKDGKKYSTYVHKVVCETFHKFPVPNGVTEEEWKRTPASVKRLMKGLFQVNHIDHNHENFHPSNLEWVTAKENQIKFQSHRKSK